MKCSIHIFSIVLGRLWTKGRTSQYSGRSLTSRSLESSSSHIGSCSLQSPLLFVSPTHQSGPAFSQADQRTQRSASRCKQKLLSSKSENGCSGLELACTRCPSFLFAARPKISTTLLRFGLEACSENWICDLSGAISDRLTQILQSFSDIKLSSPTKSAGSMHDCRTTLPGSYSR